MGLFTRAVAHAVLQAHRRQAVEEATYDMLRAFGNIELRQYAPYVVTEVGLALNHFSHHSPSMKSNSTHPELSSPARTQWAEKNQVFLGLTAHVWVLRGKTRSLPRIQKVKMRIAVASKATFDAIPYLCDV